MREVVGFVLRVSLSIYQLFVFWTIGFFMSRTLLLSRFLTMQVLVFRGACIRTRMPTALNTSTFLRGDVQ